MGQTKKTAFWDWLNCQAHCQVNCVLLFQYKIIIFLQHCEVEKNIFKAERIGSSSLSNECESYKFTIEKNLLIAQKQFE